MLVVPSLNSMMMLLRSPVRPIGVQKQEHPSQISFVECPRFMALPTGGVGRVRSRPRVFMCVHRSAAESLDGFSPSLPSRCLKRGRLTKEENWSSSLLLCPRARVLSHGATMQMSIKMRSRLCRALVIQANRGSPRSLRTLRFWTGHTCVICSGIRIRNWTCRTKTSFFRATGLI
jgi:hypothetical protein